MDLWPSLWVRVCACRMNYLWASECWTKSVYAIMIVIVIGKLNILLICSLVIKTHCVCNTSRTYPRRMQWYMTLPSNNSNSITTRWFKIPTSNLTHDKTKWQSHTIPFSIFACTIYGNSPWQSCRRDRRKSFSWSYQRLRGQLVRLRSVFVEGWRVQSVSLPWFVLIFVEQPRAKLCEVWTVNEGFYKRKDFLREISTFSK